MQFEYYTLPFNLENVMCQKEHDKCSVRQSVAQHLHLIFTTAYNEFPTDEYFGCAIWDYDFDNLTSGSRMKEIIRQSMLKSINEFEKRLTSVHVELQVRQEEILDGTSERRVKKRMDIMITGLLRITDEKFKYEDSFYVGPLSY